MWTAKQNSYITICMLGNQVWLFRYLLGVKVRGLSWCLSWSNSEVFFPNCHLKVGRTLSLNVEVLRFPLK